MSMERDRGNGGETDPKTEERIMEFLQEIADQFFTEPEVIEDIVRNYIEMRSLPSPRGMKEWKKEFLKEKKDLIRREIILAQVEELYGIPKGIIVEIILPEFLEEYPFPPRVSGEDDWREWLLLVCAERMPELQEYLQELIKKEEKTEENEE